MVTPILHYEDIETLQELIRRLRKAGAMTNSSCGIHIHIGADRHTPKETKHRLRELEQSGAPDPAEHDLLKRKISALKEIKEYIVSGDWTRKASREKFVALVKSKFDYKLIAKRFHTTEASLNVFASRQDKRLHDVMGDALSLIYTDRIEEGLSSFYIKAGIISAKEFDYRVSELLPRGENKDKFLIIECGEEVEILRFLMRCRMQEWLGSGKYRTKLAYLMFLLCTDETEYQQQKRELVCRLWKKDS